MKSTRILPRGPLSLTHIVRPSSHAHLHTSSELHITRPSRQPENPAPIKPLRTHTIASMPKETPRLSEVLRHNPVAQRRANRMDHRNPAPGATFREMAEARIAVLENALDNLHTNPVQSTEKPKKVRNRKQKLDAYTSEIRDLKRQLESREDGTDEPPPVAAPSQPETVVPAFKTPRSRQREEECLSESEAKELGLYQDSYDLYDGSRYDRAERSDSDPYSGPLPNRRRPAESPQTPRGWRPGHIDERVNLPSPRTPGTPDPAGRKDKINKPSKASGGVPEPSPEYIKQVSLPPREAAEPRHILVIIDLNGALIHRPSRKQPTLYIARNSTDKFIDYLFSRFKCMVWSAARPNNVEMMCRQLFPGRSRNNLVAEWGRDKMGLSAEDYNKRTQVYKRLETVWEDRSIQAAHPLRQWEGKWDQTNTVLIDDSREKARAHPFNLIKVPEFEGQKESEDILRMVAEYLDDLLVQEDVSAFMHKKPFKIAGDDS